MRFIPAVSPVRIQVPLPDKGAAIFTAPFIWPVGQAVKTPPFHGGNMGSIPVRVTMTENTLELVSRVFLLVLPLYSENSELFRGKIFL